MLARYLRVGDCIYGVGRVETLIVNHQDVADQGEERGWIPEAVVMNGGIRARLAAEASDGCYKRVPFSVTVTAQRGLTKKTYHLGDEVQATRAA